MEVFELYRSDLEKQKCLRAAFIRFPCSDMNPLMFYSCKGRAGRGTSQGQHPPAAVVGSEQLSWEVTQQREEEARWLPGRGCAPRLCPWLALSSQMCLWAVISPLVCSPTPDPTPVIRKPSPPSCHLKFPWPRTFAS